MVPVTLRSNFKYAQSMTKKQIIVTSANEVTRDYSDLFKTLVESRHVFLKTSASSNLSGDIRGSNTVQNVLNQHQPSN